MRYLNIETDEIFTEDELRADYEQKKRNGELEEFYDTFEYYLRHCLTENNGSLQPIADDWMIHRLQRKVAEDIACEDMPYGKCIDVIQKYNMFGTWSTWEINNRPVDVDEIREMVEQELGLW